MINSYPQVYNLGHKAIEGIFDGEVLLEEKVDGSQLSFGMIDGELQVRSKSAQMQVDAPEKMFGKAIETIRNIAPRLHPGWIYRGEYLSKPKHNTLAYDRVPKGHIIGFDIQTGDEIYMTRQDKVQVFGLLDLETVPVLYQGVVSDLEMFKKLLETVSILGGTQIEGVVVKNYNLFTRDKKVAMGKYVSEKYKEIAGGEWRKNNPTGKDIETMLIERYRTPARWQKAVQHLRERGELEQSPRDIGKLMIEAAADLQKECQEEIKEVLFAHFWQHIRRGAVAGLPVWYKEQLLESAFSTDGERGDLGET